ncbi:putative ribonuclease H-like domain-containing protein [Tanacetum coccineum]
MLGIIGYVVPTGRVVVPTGRYVVPAGKVIIIVSPGRLSLVPTGRVLSPGSDNESDDASVHSEATIAQQQQNIQPQIITTVSNNNAKFPYLKKDEYEVWAMKMEYWITNNDMNIWKVIQNGNSLKRTGRDRDGRVIILPPTTADEHIAVQRESKARTTLLQSIPDDHVADFHYMDDARDIWNAVKARFGGNAESKKMRKSMLKQEFSEFRISEAEGLHKGYDRMQKILSQLNQLKAKPEDEDINLKFLRALPSSWSQVALTLKTKGPSHSAFVSTTSASKKMSYADSPSYSSSTYTAPSNSKTGSHRSGNVIEDVLQSFVADTEPEQQLAYEDFEQIEKIDLEEMDLKWQMAMLSVRVHKFEQKAGRKIDFDKKESAMFNKKKVRCYKCLQRGHFARECRAKGGNDKQRYSSFKIQEIGKKEEDSKALITVDTLVDWTEHDGQSDGVIAPKEFEGAAKIYNLITGADTKEASTAGDAGEFALMGVTSESSEVNTNDFASSDLVSNLQAKSNDSTSCASTSSVSTSESEAEIESNVGTPIQEPIIVQDLPSFSCNSSDKNENTSRTSCNKNGYFNKKAGHFRKNASSVSKTGKVNIPPARPQPVPTGKPKVPAPVPMVHLVKTVCKQAVLRAFEHKNNTIRKLRTWNCKLTKNLQYVPQAVLLRTHKVNITPARPQPVPTGKPQVPTPVPTGRQNMPIPVSTGRVESPSVTSGWWQSTARPMPHLIRPTSFYFQTYTPYVPQMYYNHMQYDRENPYLDAEDEGIFGSGSSKSMTGNMERLDDFQEFQGGKVTFRGGEGRITGIGTIRTPTLDFENVYYVKELQQFNLFSISQICDKKNRVLFTDTDCLVLSKDFMLPDESMVLLRVPRKHNLYTINLNNLCPKGNLACLVAKASVDESVKWHRRMGHVTSSAKTWTATTPYEAQNPKSKNEPDSPVNVHLYRSMIGSLMYLTASRPDIMFAVSACSRNQVTPTTSNLEVVKKIFKYLKGQPKLGLWYPRESPFMLEAYSDSDYARANKDRKSTTGGSEYVAAANCCGQSEMVCIDDLPIAEIYSGMDNLGYVTEGKLTFYKNKFSPQWRFLVHTILHCLSTKSGSWDQFGSSLAVALICLSDGRKFNWSSYIFKGMVSNIGNAKKFLMYPRFLQTILGIETSFTRQYHVFKLSSKLFANMKLNFEGQPMQLLAAMLPQDQEGEGAGVATQAVTPPIPEPMPTPPRNKTSRAPIALDDDPFTSTNVEDEPLGGSFHASPPRSTQAPPAGHTSGGAEDLITLTAVSSVVSTLVQKVNSLETELKDTKKLFKDVVGKLVKKVKAMEVKLKTKKRKVVVSDSDQEEGGEQDVDLDALLALANAAVIVDSNIPPGGASSSHIPTDVPTGVAPAGVLNKGKTPMVEEDIIVKERTLKQMEDDRLGEEAAKRLHDEEQAQVDRQRAELNRRRQQEVLASAMYYTEADWINIMAQVEANASLSKTLLGDDVTEDNFPVRMAALIKRKKQALNQSSALYSTGWTKAKVESFTNAQLKEEFEKIQKALANTQVQAFSRTLKRTGPELEEPSSKQQKSTEATIPSVPDVPQPPVVSSTKSSGTKRKSLGRNRLTKPKSILKELDESDDASVHSDANIAQQQQNIQPQIITTVSNNNAKFPYLKKDEYEYYENYPVAGAGLMLWGDLQVLMDSQAGGKGSLVWNHQSHWQIRSWRLYTLSNVHVLETVSGEVLYMFSDVSYPLSVKLMERMLKHKLEIDKDVVGNDMTTAEQLIRFIKNQIAAAQVSPV